LVELQLEVIEGLESDEEDPKRLDGLFRLDHLATRLRRNGENLQVLAGGSPARRDHGPVGVVELLRAATSEVNDYRRVGLADAPAATGSGLGRAVPAHRRGGAGLPGDAGVPVRPGPGSGSGVQRAVRLVRRRAQSGCAGAGGVAGR